MAVLQFMKKRKYYLNGTKALSWFSQEGGATYIIVESKFKLTEIFRRASLIRNYYSNYEEHG
jgi:hypothetical protein